MKLVYIVISNNPMNDFRYHIDSAWTSKKKAQKRCNELNSEEKSKWREEYGYGLFGVEVMFLSK